VKAWPLYTALGLAAIVAIAANRRRDLAAAFDFTPLDASGGEAITVEPIPDDTTGSDGEVGQGSTFDALLALVDPSTYVPSLNDVTTEQQNLAAFLEMICVGEGTQGDDGYSIMFGNRRFHDFSDHPRDPMQFRASDGRMLWSSAAGKWQFMAISPIPGGGHTTVNTWDRLKRKLNLPDFSPASQRAAAIELIRENGALNDVYAGRVEDAIDKCRLTWASLPGAGYGQREEKLASALANYERFGGTFA